MMEEKLEQILSKKIRSDNLAHFYIIEPERKDEQDYSYQWLTSLLESSLETTHLENDPDIMLLNAQSDKNYSSEDITAIHEFMHYPAGKLSRKFLLINKAHLLSEINLNKLLKTFEEPPVKTSIFLINNHKIKLLPTILSRGVLTKIKLPKQTMENFFQMHVIKEMSFTEFNQNLEELNISTRQLLSQFMAFINLTPPSFSKMLGILQELKALEDDLIFRNSDTAVRLKIYHLAQSS